MGPNDGAISDLLALQGDPEASPYLDSVLAMLQRNNEDAQAATPILSDAQAGFAGAISPLVADENGHNLTKTGQVNTTGAVERINAASPKWHPGVVATKDKNGQVAISNGPATSSTPSPIQTMPNISSDMFAAISRLKTTTDGDVARGLLSDIRESAAQRSSSLMSEAMNFASNKLGVPTLEMQLKEAEAADKGDSAWYPGIGDSPITAHIRTALLTTRSSVDNEAKNYLSSNTSYASMAAALKTAEEEAKRIDRLTQRADNVADTLSLRRQDKNDAIVAAAQDTMNAMSPTQLARISLLNPTLTDPTLGPDEVVKAKAKTIASASPARKEALLAPDQELPILAMENNQDALILTMAMEKTSNPRATDGEIHAKLQAVIDLTKNPTQMNKSIVQARFGTLTTPEAKSALQDLNAKTTGFDGTDKAMARKDRLNHALGLYKQGATDRFASDASNWGVSDPTMQKAIDDSFKATGNRKLENVLSAFVGDSMDTAALTKAFAFSKMLERAVNGNAKSLFGMPDSMALTAQVIRSLRTKGLIGNVIAKQDANTASQYVFGSPVFRTDPMSDWAKPALNSK